MHRQQRLTDTKQFSAVRREGKSRSDSLLVLIARPNGLETTRFGFSVGKRTGKAVERNKIKRRLREAARLTKVHGGWDLLLIARRDTHSANFRQLRQSTISLLRKVRVLDESYQRSPTAVDVGMM